jgi:hypothetical protein
VFAQKPSLDGVPAAPFVTFHALHGLNLLMHCEERERLTNAFLDAVNEHFEAGRGVADPTSEEWRTVTAKTRKALREALAAMNAHKQQHGC